MKKMKLFFLFVFILSLSCTTGEARRSKERETRNADILLKSIESADQPFVNGKRLLDEGSFDEALLEFKKSSYSQSVFYKAVIYKEKGELEKAEKFYRKSIEQKTFSAESYYSLGLIFFEKGDKEEAENFMKKALEINSQHIPSLYFLGNLRFIEMKLDESLEYYKRGLEIDRNKTELWDAVFTVKLQKGEWEECWKLRDKVELTDPVILINLLKIGQMLENFEEAEKLVPSEMKGNAEINQELRVVLTRQGKLAQAVQMAGKEIAGSGRGFAVVDRGGSGDSGYLLVLRDDSVTYLVCAKDPEKELPLTIDGNNVTVHGLSEKVDLTELPSFSVEFCKN